MRGYSKEIKEYAKVKMESTNNNTTIARDIINTFNIDIDLDSVRKNVSNWRDKLKIIAKKQPIKRLFFDIETSYYDVRMWDIGWNLTANPEQIISQKKVICISYKWQYEDKVHTLTWDNNQNEKKMLEAFIKVMAKADELVGHNIDQFDIKVLRTRCIANNVLMYPTYRTLDTCKKARQYFANASNKLDYLGKFLNVGKKLDHSGLQMWIDVVEKKCKKALKKMVSYCEQDVILNQDVYEVMSPYMYHNTNFAVLTGGHKWECPECASDNIEMYHTYTTAMGVVRRNMKCNDCKKQYRVSNKTYMSMLKNIAGG
jgi:DNA polymerase elongation subunit (family B)